MILFFLILFWSWQCDTTPISVDSTLALFPIGLGLGRSPLFLMRNYFRGRRHWELLFRPIGTYWWTRLLNRVLLRSPFLLGVFTLGRIIRIVAAGSSLALIAVICVMIEFGITSGYEYLTSLVPLLPLVVDIIHSSPVSTVVSTVGTTLVWWKKLIWLGLFIWSEFFSIPLGYLSQWGYWGYECTYTYIVGMVGFLKGTSDYFWYQAPVQDFIFNLEDVDGEEVLQDVIPGVGEKVWSNYVSYMWTEFYSVHTNLINESWRAHLHLSHPGDTEYLERVDHIIDTRSWYFPALSIVATSTILLWAGYTASLVGTTLVYMSS